MLGSGASGSAIGEMRLRLSGGEALERYFSVIPSETSLAERMFLYFLARDMTGKGDILELGPFLGGTTRALAHGMEHSAVGSRRLLTVDQFDNYYDISTFEQFGIKETGAGEKMLPFREIFERFHQQESYFPFIDTRTVKIADLPEEATDYAFLEDLDNLQAVFVDGCKSWYSVKDFISRVVEHTEVGAYYLFQDYGRFTCFWIPAFVESFPDHFRFVGSVDSTFAFRLIKPLPSTTIDEVFSDQPDGMEPAVMDALFERVFAREKADDRAGGMVNSRIQTAAFHAYVGDKDKARQLLLNLQRQPFVRNNLVDRVKDALHSPTYTPNGKVLL